MQMILCFHVCVTTLPVAPVSSFNQVQLQQEISAEADVNDAQARRAGRVGYL